MGAKLGGEGLTENFHHCNLQFQATQEIDQAILPQLCYKIGYICNLIS